jgi:phospholipase C
MLALWLLPCALAMQTWALGVPAELVAAQTPIKYLVIIYQENVSFDHYFATYPYAENPPGEPAFRARAGTPDVNGLRGPLLWRNPNAVQPFRLSRDRAATCDQNHDYGREQSAYNQGLVNRVVEASGTGDTANYGQTKCQPGDVMGYFDGNTVTALWNYAQRYAMSDNHFATVFGPSTPGAINLVSGQTHGATGSCERADASSQCVATAEELKNRYGVSIVQRTLIGDAQPRFDDCSTRETAEMAGRNVGDLLSARGVTWGFFQGGFRPTSKEGEPVQCAASHVGSGGSETKDYIPHHEPFQYYASTSNPKHLPPESVARIGHNADRANHQYDYRDFLDAADAHNLPQVSIVKAPAFQDGHAGYSDPLAEQRFLVRTINFLQAKPEWTQMAIIVTYDDSDGWYDHVMPPIIRGSNTSEDKLTGPGSCGEAAAGAAPGRCGYGPRLPLLVISPWAKKNYISHALTDQVSILRFIEDNWNLGRLNNGADEDGAGTLDALFDFSGPPAPSPFLLDEATGEPLS